MMRSVDQPCPACDAVALEVFFEAPAVPVFCNVLWPTAEQALASPRGAIELAHCGACGLLYNVAFDSARIAYEGTYENSLHFSPHFQAFADALADRLVERWDLRGRNLLELGCGFGDFLASLCERGENVGRGFDPGHNPEHVARPGRGSLRIEAVPFDRRHTDVPVDFLLTRHVLEHIPRPLEWLREIREIVLTGNRPDYYLEVPNALYTLRDMGIWDIIYEHCSYFTPPALARLLTRAGYQVGEIQELYAGQFLGVEGSLAGGPEGSIPGPTPDEIAGMVADFGSLQQAKVSEWRGRVADAAGRVVVWGGGSKGVTFLNLLGAGVDRVPLVVDVNPRKHGRFVAGTGQRIVSPEALQADPPELILVMNGVYLEEIRSQVGSLGLGSALATV